MIDFSACYVSKQHDLPEKDLPIASDRLAASSD